MKSYRLTTITYGTSSASFTATNYLVSLADEISSNNPKVSNVIQHNFYMDDLMTGWGRYERRVL